MATSKVKRKNPNWIDKYKKQISTLGKKEVAVGFPAGKGLGTPYYDGGASVLQVAFWNNYGTKRIPARPFMDFASIKIQRDFKAIVAQDVKACKDGKLPEPVMLNRWGSQAKGMVQNEITNLTEPPNSPMTIALKGSSKPLINTGHMRQSVTFVVRNKSK